ncbi:hypothetical protein TNCV_3651471 [Trichonephila clavipes]|nr:hypothetical protein TNCV_3651471 [Trichonephila clavipes]
MLYSDASGVEHTDSGPHNSGNKSSGRMNRRSPYSKPPGAFMCGERPKKHLLPECIVTTVKHGGVGPLCKLRIFLNNLLYSTFQYARAPLGVHVPQFERRWARPKKFLSGFQSTDD